jgi:hypothetical protein
MKCTLELYGTHESTEFSDRHAFGMVAAISAGGVNLKSLFEQLLGAKALKESVLGESGMDSLFREFDMEVADKNFSYLLKKVFPTFPRSIDELSTADMISIVAPMITTVVQSEQELAKSAIAPEPLENLTSDSALDESDELEDNPHPKVKSTEFPPVLASLTPKEINAIGFAARDIEQPYVTIECWYQWWRSISDVGGEDIGDAEAFEILEDFTKGFFPTEESDRIATALMPHLQPAPEPIAA